MACILIIQKGGIVMQIIIETGCPWDKKQKRIKNEPYPLKWFVQDFNELNQDLVVTGEYDASQCVPDKDRSDEVSSIFAGAYVAFHLPDEIFHQVGEYPYPSCVPDSKAPIYEVDINDLIRSCREVGLNLVQ